MHIEVHKNLFYEQQNALLKTSKRFTRTSAFVSFLGANLSYLVKASHKRYCANLSRSKIKRKIVDTPEIIKKIRIKEKYVDQKLTSKIKRCK